MYLCACASGMVWTVGWLVGWSVEGAIERDEVVRSAQPGERAMAETRTILICIFSGRPGKSAGKHVKALYNTSPMKKPDFPDF